VVFSRDCTNIKQKSVALSNSDFFDNTVSLFSLCAKIFSDLTSHIFLWKSNSLYALTFTSGALFLLLPDALTEQDKNLLFLSH